MMEAVPSHVGVMQRRNRRLDCRLPELLRATSQKKSGSGTGCCLLGIEAPLPPGSIASTPHEVQRTDTS